MNTLLHLNSSGRYEGSLTRQVSQELVTQLEKKHSLSVTHRDLAKGTPFIDESWIHATFTPEEQRSAENKAALALSDTLVDELVAADTIVLAAPIYNFSVPAATKAWIDQIARVGRTFVYTENGPKGLLENKKAYVVIASGGVPIGSEMDFASGYLTLVLGFVGIQDVTIINAASIVQDEQTPVSDAVATIIS